MKNELGALAQIWRAHIVVAVLVGLVVGTGIGVGEGIAVLQSQELFGRYNELVAWAIAFDASAMIALEVAIAIVGGIMFSFARVVPIWRHLVALQLGETAFAAVLGIGIWQQGNQNPAIFAGDPIGALLPLGLEGLIIGAAVLALSFWLAEHAPFVRKLRIRYWLVFEAVVVVSAVAFGFSH